MLAEKPNCGLFVFVVFHLYIEQTLFVFFFPPKLVNCTFYGTQKRKFFWFAWWSTWLNWRFDFLISRIKKLLLQTSICVFVVKMWLAAFSFFYPTLGLPLKCRRSFHARFLKKKKICHIFSSKNCESTTSRIILAAFFCLHFWGATSHTSASFNWKLVCTCPGGGGYCKSSTLSVVSSTLQGNKPHPAEARISKSVGLVSGHLKHPQFVLRFAHSCVRSAWLGRWNDSTGALGLFGFAWLIRTSPCTSFGPVWRNIWPVFMAWEVAASGSVGQEEAGLGPGGAGLAPDVERHISSFLLGLPTGRSSHITF